MREVYKNPMLYYLLIPVLVGLWPLLVWGFYLPRAEHDREIEGGLCVEGQARVIDILQLDPDRPNITPEKGQITASFDYGNAVARVANLCKIPPSNCPFTSSGTMVSGGKKRQDARVELKNVGIVQAAKFLWTMQSMWATLQCEAITLTKNKGTPDQWNVDLRFMYHY
ncbi:MAG: hypothetical protein M1376_20735 [Planctomycetes bacterium]|nr:hypothetical protein [Planctomycetota bacterium]